MQLRPAFAAFGRDFSLGGRFGDALDGLKDRLADPVADRICEALRMSREVGRQRPRSPAAQPVGVPARGRAYPVRDRGPAELDRVRRPTRGGRAVAGARAAGDPAGVRRGLRPAGRCRGARRGRPGLPGRLPADAADRPGARGTAGCCDEPDPGHRRRARRCARASVCSLVLGWSPWLRRPRLEAAAGPVRARRLAEIRPARRPRGRRTRSAGHG